MSQFEQGNAPADFVRRGLPPVPRQGIQVQRTAPGLVPVPYAPTEGAVLAAQLMRALGVAGDTLGYAGRLADQHYREVEHNAAVTAAAERGLGASAAQSAAPAIADAIQRGELASNGRPNDVWFEDIATQHTAGLPGEAAQAFRDQLRPAFERAVVARNQAVRQQAVREQSDLILAGATAPGADLGAAATALHQLDPANITEQAARQAVVAHTLDYAGRTGNGDLLRSAQAAAPPGLETEIAKAQASFAETTQRLATQRDDSFREYVNGRLNSGAGVPQVRAELKQFRGSVSESAYAQASDALSTIERTETARARTEDAQRRIDAAQATSDADAAAAAYIDSRLSDHAIDGTPLSVVRAELLMYRNEMSDSAFQAKLHEVDSRIASEQSKPHAAALRAEKQTFEASAVARGQALIRGGFGSAIDKARFIASDGTEHEMSRAEIEEKAYGLEFARIDQELKDDPGRAELAKIKLASDNGYMPPQWAHQIVQGAAAARTAAKLENRQPADLAPVLAAYERYRVLRAAAPGLLSGVSDDAVRLFDLASTAQLFPAVGADAAQALLVAARTLNNPSAGHLSSDAMDKVDAEARNLGAGFFSGAKHANDARTQMLPLARLMVMNNTDPAKAVKAAAEIVRERGVSINGWWQNIGNAQLPAIVRGNIKPLSEKLLSEWYEAHGKALGRSVDEFTLRRDPQSEIWVVSYGDTGFPVGGPGAAFGPSDMKKRVVKMLADNDEGLLRDIQQRQNTPYDPRMEYLSHPTTGMR